MISHCSYSSTLIPECAPQLEFHNWSCRFLTMVGPARTCTHSHHQHANTTMCFSLAQVPDTRHWNTAVYHAECSTFSYSTAIPWWSGSQNEAVAHQACHKDSNGQSERPLDWLAEGRQLHSCFAASVRHLLALQDHNAVLLLVLQAADSSNNDSNSARRRVRYASLCKLGPQ